MKEFGPRGELIKIIEGEKFHQLDIHGGRLTAVSTHIEAARRRNRERVAAEKNKKMPDRRNRR